MSAVRFAVYRFQEKSRNQKNIKPLGNVETCYKTDEIMTAMNSVTAKRGIILKKVPYVGWGCFVIWSRYGKSHEVGVVCRVVYALFRKPRVFDADKTKSQ